MLSPSSAYGTRNLSLQLTTRRKFGENFALAKFEEVNIITIWKETAYKNNGNFFVLHAAWDVIFILFRENRVPKFCGHFCFELSLAWKMASSKANRNSKNLKDRISEDLAQLIEHEECIWNLKHPDYKSHDTRAQAWIRVGSNLRQMYSEDDLRQVDLNDEEGLKLRWRALVDKFNRFEAYQKSTKSGQAATNVNKPLPKFIVSIRE